MNKNKSIVVNSDHADLEPRPPIYKSDKEVEDMNLAELVKNRLIQTPKTQLRLPKDNEYTERLVYQHDDPEINKPKNFEDIPYMYQGYYITRVHDPQKAMMYWLTKADPEDTKYANLQMEYIRMVGIVNTIRNEVNRKLRKWWRVNYMVKC